MQKLMIFVVAIVTVSACSQPQPITIRDMNPGSLKIGYNQVTINGERLNQVKDIKGASSIVATPTRLTFNYTLPQNNSGSVTFQLLDSRGQAIPTNLPLSFVAETFQQQTIAKLQDDIKALTMRLDALKLSDLQDSKEFRTNLINDATRRVNAAVTAINKQISAHSSQISAIQSDLSLQKDQSNSDKVAAQTRMQKLEQEQSALSQQISKISSSLEQEIRSQRQSLDQIAAIQKQQAADIPLLLSAVEMMGQRKVGGVLGIGKKTQLPEGMLNQIRARTGHGTSTNNLSAQPAASR